MGFLQDLWFAHTVALPMGLNVCRHDAQQCTGVLSKVNSNTLCPVLQESTATMTMMKRLIIQWVIKANLVSFLAALWSLLISY